jgi:hypothetical protein
MISLVATGLVDSLIVIWDGNCDVTFKITKEPFLPGTP